MEILSSAVKTTIIYGEKKQIKNSFQIALTGTANYIPHIGLTMMSICKNNPQMDVTFHLFLNGLPDVESKRLKEMVRCTHQVVCVHIMNDVAFKSLIFGDKTAVFFYRFVVADLLKEYSDRVLYIDGDTMCNGSLELLRKLDLKDCIAAVMPDRLQKKQMRQIGTQGFFNAGVMLIHVSQWCKEAMFTKVVNMALESLKKIDDKGYYEGWHGLKYNDQNILNKMLDGRVLWLPKKYNYIYKLNRPAFFRKAEKNEDYKNQVILHFAGSVKPWHDWVKEWPAVKEYIHVWQQSPWKDVPMTKPVSRKDFHQAGREYRVTGQYGKALRCYWEYYKRKL